MFLLMRFGLIYWTDCVHETPSYIHPSIPLLYIFSSSSLFPIFFPTFSTQQQLNGRKVWDVEVFLREMYMTTLGETFICAMNSWWILFISPSLLQPSNHLFEPIEVGPAGPSHTWSAFLSFHSWRMRKEKMDATILSSFLSIFPTFNWKPQSAPFISASNTSADVHLWFAGSVISQQLETDKDKVTSFPMLIYKEKKTGVYF